MKQFSSYFLLTLFLFLNFLLSPFSLYAEVSSLSENNPKKFIEDQLLIKFKDSVPKLKKENIEMNKALIQQANHCCCKFKEDDK